MEKVRSRCTKCGSVDIYKRSRYDEINKTSDIKIKKYICRECIYEFDKPFIGKKKKTRRARCK